MKSTNEYEEVNKFMKQKSVSAIKNGTVIDHIPPNNTFKILQVLNLKDESITVGNNFPSSRMGKKGVIKIADKNLTKTEIDKIAILANKSTLCTIDNYIVKEKTQINLPTEFKNIIKCFNPNCITRFEPTTTVFKLLNEKPLKLLCHHCESEINEENITLL